MKTIGLIGGMSWESTVTYYQIVNETVKRELGGLHSAKILLYSVDFAEIEEYQAKGEWEKSAGVLTEAAMNLERAGADYLVICTNTMHKVAPEIRKHISIPIIHIAEATAEELKKNSISRVGLLGTKYTMTQEFYKSKLIDGFTKKYNVCKLVYYERTHNINAAIAREKQIKGWTRIKKNALIHEVNPTWNDLFEMFENQIDNSDN